MPRKELNRKSAQKRWSANSHGKEPDSADIEKYLIEQLRREAEAVKDCYTKFAFQAWSFTAATVALLFAGSGFVPQAAFACPLVALVILSVTRVGLHKYATANRHFGFEVYLHRRRRFTESTKPGGWRPFMREIGWEEAHYAWRIVQAGLYREIHSINLWRELPFTSIRPKRAYSGSILAGGRTQRQNRKFMPHYHPGGYLAKTFASLHAMAIFSTFPLAASAVIFLEEGISWNAAISDLALLLDKGVWAGGQFELFWGTAGLFALVNLGILLRIRRTSSLRRLRESGLLSINSCAIVWSAVVVAHHRALKRVEDGILADHETYKPNPSEQARLGNYKGYSEALEMETKELVTKMIGHPHEGIYQYIDTSGPVQAAIDTPQPAG